SLLEYAVNGQFRQFTAEVGVDAATGGRGSVVFEVYGDGRKLWSSPLMSGLDKPRKVDINIVKVNRLKLIVNDGEDGNRLDAANWCAGALR
ncbi:MAG: NPCBM/NEW2 domain-containing protein, partial [Pirellulales bacterium]